MTTQLVDPKAVEKAEAEFQQKMKERMRQAMGDLMPDSVLQGIIAKGIEEAFFTKQVRNTGGYYGREETFPSWTVEFLQKECKDQVQTQIKVWIAQNKEKIEEILLEVINKGIVQCVSGAINSLFYSAMDDFQNQILATIKNSIQS